MYRNAPAPGPISPGLGRTIQSTRGPTVPVLLFVATGRNPSPATGNGGRTCGPGAHSVWPVASQIGGVNGAACATAAETNTNTTVASSFLIRSPSWPFTFHDAWFTAVG